MLTWLAEASNGYTDGELTASFARGSIVFALALLCILFAIKRKPTLFKKEKVLALDFSSVEPHPLFKVADTLPHAYRPWKAGRYNMTMGIRKMQEDEWLVIDNLYQQEQELRRHLLMTNRNGVMQCLPSAEEACREALEAIVKFLVKRYPSHFQLLKGRPDYIHNGITGLTFRYLAPYEQHPLEIAAQLVMEDINILMRGTGGEPDEYYLQASYSMAPAGWYIEKRIGWALYKIHAPVPLWNEKLRKAMQRFYLTLKTSSPVERNNYFLQTDDTLFQQEPFPDSWPSPQRLEDLHIRYERQTLRRLPRTGAIVFMVRTYLKPITDIKEEKDSLYALRSAIRGWPPETAKYKGRHVWATVFEKWCEEVLGDYVPSDPQE